MARSRPSRQRGATLRLLRVIVAVAVAMLLALEIWVLPTPWWAYGALLLCAAAAALTAMWRIVPAIALTIALLAGELALGSRAYSFLPLLVTTVLVVAMSPSRTAILTCVGYATVFAVETARWGIPGATKLILLSIFVLIGVAFRVLLGRTRRADAQIEELGTFVADIRRAVRRELSDELATLLTADLAHNQSILRNPAGHEVPQLRALLTDIAVRSRTSLARLRELMSDLRHSGSGVNSANLSLFQTIEALEDELVSLGHTVELTLPPQDSPVPLSFQRALREVSDHTRAAALPGSTLVVEVTRLPSATQLHVRYPVEPEHTAHPTTLRSLSHTIEHSGGQLALHTDTNEASFKLLLPDAKPPSKQGTRASEALHRARFAIRVIAVVGVTIPVSWALGGPHSEASLWPHALMWILTWLALLLSSWRLLAGIALFVALLLWGLTSPFTLALLHPVHLQWMLLGGLVSARRPRATLPLLAASVIYGLAWNALDSPLNALGLPLYPMFGCAVGASIAFFVVTRRQQLDEVSRLEEEAAEARAEEHRQLASELHDIVAHQLSQMTMQVTAHVDSTDPKELKATLERVAAINQQAQQDLITLISIMRQGEEAQHGSSDKTKISRCEDHAIDTPAATAEAVAALLRESGRTVVVEVDPQVDDLRAATRRTTTRILREATTNILRYAPPQGGCELLIRCIRGGVQVMVASPLDGTNRTSPDSTGYGLLGLRERIGITGGSFQAGPQGGRWVVRASLPNDETEALTLA